MLKWIKGGISAVTGMAEPEYGKDSLTFVVLLKFGASIKIAALQKDSPQYSGALFFGKLLTIQYVSLDLPRLFIRTSLGCTLHPNLLSEFLTLRHSEDLTIMVLPLKNGWKIFIC
ncbi:CMF_collapsed_G0013030.mRNA.1.CDS.1 [Saccharomyces cerevisiae]|nr:CMF_collapsed_G0013030.mRNA.1.CDS.1 [Saccharomyces cerevisiae]